MLVTLIPHPDTPSAVVSRIAVEVGLVNGRQMRLRYEVEGRLEELLAPAPADPERADDLWKHTCFEAFARMAGSEAYDEFNFSPSSEWAVYRFDGYRTGMNKPVVLAPRVAGGMEGEVYVLHAAFDLPGSGPWRVGLSAVIEDMNGGKSYWALKHAPGKPDFHNAASFALELP